MINSKQKGKRGELEWCRVCREHGYDVKRSQQFCGKSGEAQDCIGLDYIHQEIKRVERININEAMKQAISDNSTKIYTHSTGSDNEGEGTVIKPYRTMEKAVNHLFKNKKIPIVAHKKKRHEWLITMRAEDWFKFYDSYLEQRKNKNDD